MMKWKAPRDVIWMKIIAKQLREHYKPPSPQFNAHRVTSNKSDRFSDFIDKTNYDGCTYVREQLYILLLCSS